VVHLSKRGYLESSPHANITTHTLTPAYIKCRTNLISCNFDVVEIKDSFNNAKIFSDFVKIVNSQSSYNQVGNINAVPLITFHNVELNTNRPYYTNAILFERQ
jgi:hypothetical protein